ncbi:aldo/keto reductase [Lactonifactor longoviformis]|uniref:aldo/keto reductase n=1 Tax=Lactonifactor longoviformis TaxID=341220 RepID=UPI002109A401|nr:aldo/keto reductase [Lactonifactor longoviformis]MCQ4672883.1 aldo/keto reductase [Lactonifactor longoviformis]
MYYKSYGNTGIKVSAVGLGTMRYDAEDIRAGRLEKCAEIPLYAFEKGINYWDTAPNYCEDKSEIVTGMALSQIKRSQVYVTSKTNFSTLGTEKPDRMLFRRRLEMSLQRLKTDYIDFYHMWCMLNLESWEKHMEVLYRFFEEAKAEGLIRNIVFSSHMQGNDIETVVESGKFRGMLIGYNALNYRFRQSGIEKAYENGMGVVVMNPLGGGLIPQNPKAFSYLTEGTELTVPQAALRFVASHREITVALAGCTTKAHIDDAVKAVENLEERPAKEVARRFEEKGIALNDLCTGCGYCKGCPKDIEIPKYMDAYNQKILTGKVEEINRRFRFHWDVDKKLAAECVACGKCEEQCTQHLPIIERMREIANLPDSTEA